MCDTCGCAITPGTEHVVEVVNAATGVHAVEVLDRLLEANDHQAKHNREHFDRAGVLGINLMSSPGSGKTTLLEKTRDLLPPELRVAVVVGDLETERDADRLRKAGIEAVQITTGNACHLDAHMVHRALHHLDLDGLDVVFIENVGNLVCPASFDLGQHLNVTLLSCTEGDDKPSKYPVMFRTADLVLLTKSDLLEVLDDFDPGEAERCIRALAQACPVLSVSSRRDGGLSTWRTWLLEELAAFRNRLQTQTRAQPLSTHS
ncbi:MAG: hydrogenase nickel incorporation protein HypB [Myxococcota bacterium]